MSKLSNKITPGFQYFLLLFTFIPNKAQFTSSVSANSTAHGTGHFLVCYFMILLFFILLIHIPKFTSSSLLEVDTVHVVSVARSGTDTPHQLYYHSSVPRVVSCLVTHTSTNKWKFVWSCEIKLAHERENTASGPRD